MSDFAKKISELVAFIGLGGLIILSIVIVIDIVGRELLGMPIPGFSDITGQFIIITAAACFPASFADRSHVSVRFIGKIVHWRGREALDLLAHVATLIILCIIVVQLFTYSKHVLTNNETTWLIGLPIWPVWWTVTALMAISTIVQTIMTIKQIKRLFSSTKLADLDAVEPPPATESSKE